MKTAILVINKNGERLAKKLKEDFKNATIVKLKKKEESLISFVGKILNEPRTFHNIQKNEKKVRGEYDGLIFIAALGIVVRLIGPFIKDKFSDPAIVCVDTAGRFAISVLSGHEGGANSLTFLVARSLGALPVITTGAEVHKKIIVGIGCRRGISAAKVKKALLSILKEKNITLEKIRVVATIDLKEDEQGLIKGCSELGLPLVFIPSESVRNFKGPVSSSELVKRKIGLAGVCEPCALLAGRRAKLICPKQIINEVTVAIARES